MRHEGLGHIEIHARSLVFKVAHGGTSRIIDADLSMQRLSILMIVLDVLEVARGE